MSSSGKLALMMLSLYGCRVRLEDVWGCPVMGMGLLGGAEVNGAVLGRAHVGAYQVGDIGRSLHQHRRYQFIVVSLYS